MKRFLKLSIRSRLNIDFIIPFLLFFLTLLIRFWSITLDPFLNYWDEVFHAAVARNMLDHPFTPMLYTEPAMPVTENWSRMHIWLHKPPFFLWQIALSIGIFGFDPWAVRIPSAIWTSVLVMVVYRLTMLLTRELPLNNARIVATGASLLSAFNFYLQELTSGSLSTDHNDAIFFVMVAISWLAYWEHRLNRSFAWALFAGLASAAAVLCKWYFGLIVFLPWTAEVIYERSRHSLQSFFGALTVMLLFAGSWLAYIHLYFPKEASYERWFKALHFSVPVDGHEGDRVFHLRVIDTYLEPLTWWLIAAGLLAMVWQLKDNAVRRYVVLTVVPTHVFFSLAATKMVSYTLFLLPLYLIGIAFSLERITNNLPYNWLRKAAPILAYSVLALFLWRPWLTASRHPKSSTTKMDPHRAQQFAVLEDEPRLKSLLPAEVKVALFNLPFVYDVQFMFRTGIPCMRGIPDSITIERLHAKGYRVIVLQDGVDPSLIPGGVELIPDSVFQYPRIARL